MHFTLPQHLPNFQYFQISNTLHAKKNKERGIEKEEKKLNFLVQQKKIREIDFGVGARVMLRKENITTHFFQRLAFILSTPL